MGANKINSQDIDWSGSTGYANGAYLGFGGAFQVPTGAIPALSNIIWVAKNGNDTTALTAFTAAGNKQVFAYPFLTLAAARSAAVSLTPSATNRILIKVFSGLYVEQLVLANYVDWDLTNSIIDLQTNAATYTVTDDNVACDSNIYGDSQILRSAGASALGCIGISAATSSVKIYCNNIIATVGKGISNSGTIYIVGNVQSIANDGIVNNKNITLFGNVNASLIGLNTDTGTTIIHGNITSDGNGVYNLLGGYIYIYGDINSVSSAAIDTSNNAIVYVYGNINANNGNTIINSGSTLNITGNISSSQYSLTTSAGTTIFSGNVTSSNGNPLTINGGTVIIKAGSRLITNGTNQDAVVISNGKLILDGATIIAKGTGKCIYSTTAQNVDIYGTCTTNAYKSSNITLRTGVLQIDSTATPTAVGTLVT